MISGWVAVLQMGRVWAQPKNTAHHPNLHCSKCFWILTRWGQLQSRNPFVTALFHWFNCPLWPLTFIYMYWYMFQYPAQLVQRSTKMRFFPSVMASFLFFVVVGLACVELSTCLVVKGSVTCLDCTHHLSGSSLFFFSFVFKAWVLAMIDNAITSYAFIRDSHGVTPRESH